MKRSVLWLGVSILLLPAVSVLASGEAKPEVLWADAGKHIGEECVVVGKVVMTKNIGSMCFLNFHSDFKNNFTVVIKSKNFDKFPDAPEAMYLEKEVKITGKIIEYQGKPEIIITGPEQIVIVGEEPAPPPAKDKPDAPTPPTPPQVKPEAPPAPKVEVKPFTGIATIASYNVLNLFDAHDCPYHADEGTNPKPADELERLAATIRKVNADVLALQEVENRGVLQQFNDMYLSDLGYRNVVLYEGNDGRGIDVALLTRLPVGPVTSYRHMDYNNPDGEAARIRRDLLRVRIEPPNAKSFDVFVMHLKSKRGGAAATNVRMGEVGAARRVLDELLAQDPNARFVLCGDLNDTVDSEPIRALIGAGANALSSFYTEIPEDQRLTYNREPYRSMIDFIFSSPAMAKCYVADTHRIYPGTVESSGSDHNPISEQFDLK